MRPGPLSIATMSFALFVGALGASALTQSCSDTGAPADAGADVDLYGPGPCRDGTVRIITCTPADGAPAEAFSDEACLSLDDVSTRQGVARDDARAPVIDAPAEGAALAGDAPFTFRWHPGSLARRAPRAPTLRDEWRRLTTLVPEAEAHCAPFSGVGYAVVFRAGSQELLRAETAAPRYTPTAEDWARLRAARGAVELRVVAARFGASAVVEGPVEQATPRRFTVTP